MKTAGATAASDDLKLVAVIIKHFAKIDVSRRQKTDKKIKYRTMKIHA